MTAPRAAPTRAPSPSRGSRNGIAASGADGRDESAPEATQSFGYQSAPAGDPPAAGMRSARPSLAALGQDTPAPALTDPELVAARIDREGRASATAALRGGDPVEILAVLLLDKKGKLKLRGDALAKLAEHQDPRVRLAARARQATR